MCSEMIICDGHVYSVVGVADNRSSLDLVVKDGRFYAVAECCSSDNCGRYHCVVITLKDIAVVSVEGSDKMYDTTKGEIVNTPDSETVSRLHAELGHFPGELKEGVLVKL